MHLKSFIQQRNYLYCSGCPVAIVSLLAGFSGSNHVAHLWVDKAAHESEPFFCGDLAVSVGIDHTEEGAKIL